MENDLLVGGYNNDSDADLNNTVLYNLNEDVDEALETLLDDKASYKTYQDSADEIGSALGNADDECTLLNDIDLDDDLDEAFSNLDDDLRNLPESQEDVNNDYKVIQDYVDTYNDDHGLDTVFFDI